MLDEQQHDGHTENGTGNKKLLLLAVDAADHRHHAHRHDRSGGGGDDIVGDSDLVPALLTLTRS